jgi:hypothetical protein
MPLVIKTDFVFDEPVQKEVDKQAAKVIDMIIEKTSRDEIQKEIYQIFEIMCTSNVWGNTQFSCGDSP